MAWVVACGAGGARPAAKDHRASMCLRCKSGGVTDGGTATVGAIGCVHWCSRAGYCGDGDSYRAGLDCRQRGDLSPADLKTARATADAAASARYDADFMQHHGRLTFEQYRRAPDHAARYGAAISIRGERHSGTGWVRVMTSDNCRERHFWSPKLDSDGLYGWKHDFLPASLSPDARDAVVCVYRSAAPWVVKMRKTACGPPGSPFVSGGGGASHPMGQRYSSAIDRIGGTMAKFVSVAFSERNVRFASVVDLRSRKYAQYLALGRSHANVLGARYEDLVGEPTFLFDRLAALGFDCNARAAFRYVRGYAKFGGKDAKTPHFTPPKNATWSRADWAALVSRVDAAVERALGYAYDAAAPGRWAALPVAPESGVLRPAR